MKNGLRRLLAILMSVLLLWGDFPAAVLAEAVSGQDEPVVDYSNAVSPIDLPMPIAFNRNAGFYIRLNGQIANEPTDFGNNDNNGFATVSSGVSGAVDTDMLFENQQPTPSGQNKVYHYYFNASGVDAYLGNYPSETQIKNALNGKTVTLNGTNETVRFSNSNPYNSQEYGVIWYVIKTFAEGTWYYSIHVDGVVYKKNHNVTLTYNMGDAENPGSATVTNSPYPMSQGYKPNTEVTVYPTAPGWKGHKFNGWRSSVDGKLYQPGEKFTITQDTTLTAEWDQEMQTVRVEKIWEDQENEDGSRPASIQVQLKQDGRNFGTAATLPDKGAWSYSWTVPETDTTGKTTYKYTVEEVNAPEGYTPEVSGDATSGFKITNKHTPAVYDEVTVTKVWVDANDQDGLRPESVSVQLQQNGEPYGAAVELNDGNSWKHTWENLPQKVGGETVKYTVTETTVLDGYEVSYGGDVENGLTVTNTHTVNTIADVKVTKVWEDAGNQDNIRPESVSIQLKQNGENYGSAVTLNEENGWSYTWTGLPEYVAGQIGTKAEYTVAEPTVPEGYTVSYGTDENGLTVTNTHTVNTIADVKVTKKWVDGEGENRPESVTVQLQQNGKDYGDAVELNAANGWSYTWTGLPEHVAGEVGTGAKYSVVENVPDGYDAAYSTDEETGALIVTNTINDIDEKIDVSGTKTWVDGGKEHNNADEVKLTLSRTSANPVGGSTAETVTDVTVTWSGNTYTFADVDKYDAEGYEYTYSVAEAKVEGYDTKQTGNDFTNTVNTINDTMDVTGTKTWVDGGKEHNNAEELTLTLSRTSAKADSTAETVEAEVSWEDNKYTFKNVDKYDADGYEYTYSVAEGAVEGYTPTSDGNGNFTNTMSNIGEKTSVSGTKTWVDGGKEHNNAEELTLTLSRTSANPNGGSTVETVEATVTWEGNTYTFAGVDKYDADGYEYTYSVAEARVEGYDEPEYSGEGNFDIKNTITQEYRDIEVAKNWVDPAETEHQEVKVVLTKNGVETDQTLTLSEGNWTGKFSHLDVYDENGAVIQYNVTESVDGYTTSIAPKDANAEKYTITNTIEQDESIRITVNKKWENVPEGNALPTVTFKLFRDTVEIETKQLYPGETSVTFDNLPKYALEGVTGYTAPIDGHVFEYTVKENEIAGYTSTSVSEENSYTFTNTYKGDDSEITVTKVWSDYNYANRPTAVSGTLEAQADGEAVSGYNREWEITAPAGSVTVKVPSHTTDGKALTYTVTENAVEGYVPTVEGYTVTNTLYENPSLTIEKKTSPEEATYKRHNDTVTFVVKVTNNGNVPLHDVTVEDILPDINFPAGSTVELLNPGESMEFTALYSVTQEDVDKGSVTNTASATAKDPKGSDVQSGNATATATANPDRSLAVMKGHTLASTAYKVGDTIHFTITVENTGDATLENVIVTDETAEIVSGDGYTVNGDGTATIEKIPVGGRATVQAEYEVKQADIDAGEVVNTASAIATNVTEDDDDTATDTVTIAQNPGLTSVKELTNAGSGENGAFKANETATFTITVTNSGNTTQKNVTVSEMEDAVIVEGTGYTINEAGQAVIAEMAPGATVVVKAEYKVTQADIDSDEPLKNIATVKGDNGDNPDPTPETEIPEEPQKPGLTSVKELTNSGSGENGAFKANETATFTITVTNSGNTTQKGVTVTEQLAGAKIVEGDGYTINEAGQAVIAEMAPGAVVVVKATYTVTQADIDSNAALANIATVGSDDNEPEPTDPEPIPEEEKQGHLTVAKTTTSTPENGETYALGETITYLITVTNDGNTTLTDVTVTDELTGNVGENAWTVETLAPGESAEFEAAYEVTEADILAGTVLNVATATGANPDPDDPDPETEPGENETPTDPANPAYTVVKTVTNLPETGVFGEGETIEYNIHVENTGNVTVRSLVVTEMMAGAVIAEGEGYAVEGSQAVIEALEPGQALDVRVSYTVTNADLGGVLTNTVTATADGPDEENPEENKPEDQTSTVTVPTAERTYTLTVHYRYLDGTEAFADYVQGDLLAGTEYNVASPALAGYTVNPDVVTGVMPPMNWEVTVFYVPIVVVPDPADPAPVPGPIPVVIDEYGVPLNIGNVVMNVGDCFE